MIPVPPPILATLAATFHLTPESLTYLGGGQEYSDGITYTFDMPNGPRVFKIIPIQSDDHQAAVDERLHFIRFLADHEVDIVYPIPLEDGTLYTIAAADEGGQRFAAYVMPRIRGVHPNIFQYTPSFYTRLGKVIGRTHRVTQQYPIWKNVASPTSAKPILGWEREWSDFHTWCKDRQLKQHWLTIHDQLAALPIDRASFGFIHNDAHAENLFLEGERVILIDFDVANCFWFINDIAVAMQPLLFRVTGGIDRPCQDAAPLRLFLEQFIRGYETENHLDPSWFAKLDLFIHYRSALLFTVQQDWLSTKPAYRASWKKAILNPSLIFS